MDCLQDIEQRLSTLNHLHSQGLIEDIEQPAWSTISLSESCASQISSWCSDTRSSVHGDSKREETPDSFIPAEPSTENLQISDVPSPSISSEQLVEDMSSLETSNGLPIQEVFKDASILSGSLQSLSSSTQTLYAIPKSPSSTKLLTSFKNSKVLGLQFPFRRGSLTRDRAPSENSIVFHKSKLHHDFKLSHSLQDVSCIPSNTLQAQTRRASRNGDSLSTKHVSRDSGFNHSDSLQSLSSSGRKFSHVQSKVKLYISNLKEADSQRRKQKEMGIQPSSNLNIKQGSKESIPSGTDTVDFKNIIESLKHEVAEKDRMLSQVQENYHSLLTKYAEAKCWIDKQRFEQFPSKPPNTRLTFAQDSSKLSLVPHEDKHSVHGAFSNLKLDGKAPSDNSTSDCDIDVFESLTHSSVKLAEMFDTQSSSTCTDLSAKPRRGKSTKKCCFISTPLRPVSRLYSTSVRLDRVLSPLPDNASHTELMCSVEKKMLPSVGNTNSLDCFSHGSTDRALMEAVDFLPKEDALKKVQRWQESNGQMSDLKSKDIGKDIKRRVLEKKDKYTNVENSVKRELEGNIIQSSLPNLIGLEKSSNISVFHQCKGNCNRCGRVISVDRIEEQAVNIIDTNTSHSMETSWENRSSKPSYFMDCSKSTEDLRLKKSESSFFSGKLWNNIHIRNSQDQDHVVPSSPQNEVSLENCLQSLQKSLCSYGKTDDINNFATLLDILCKMSSRSSCYCALSTSLKSSDHIDPGSEGASLLQCLNEVDDYVSKLWVKNKTCLDKLDAGK